jgi:hypothetical protein
MSCYGKLSLVLFIALAVISSSAFLVAVESNTPSVRAGAALASIESFAASPNPVYVGGEVTFWANATSSTSSPLTFTIYYDYLLPGPVVNPESPVSVNHTDSPGSIVQTYTYDSPGNFTSPSPGLTCYFVHLCVYDGGSNVSRTLQVMIKENTAPVFVAEPAEQYSVVAGEPLEISVRVLDYDSDPIDVFWEFGDGTEATNQTDGTMEDSYANQTHTWSPNIAPGTGDYFAEYQMNVTIVDIWGNSTEANSTILVYVPENVPPAIALSASSTRIQPGESVTFYGNASDPEGEPLTWTFNYSDGTTEVVHTDWTEPDELVWCNVTHVFEEESIYAIAMHVSDALPGSQVFPHNKSVGVYVTVAVNHVPGISSLISVTPEYPIINSTIGFLDLAFSISANDLDGDVLTASWYIDDSEEPVVNTSAGGTVLYKFIQVFTVTETGSYNVTVVVTDGYESHEVTVSGVVNVTSDNRPPILMGMDFSYPTGQEGFALVGDMLDFELTFSDSEQDAMEIAIDFGDGTPEIDAVLTEYVFGNVTYVFSHSYSYADDFVMTINFTDNKVGLLNHEKSFIVEICVIEDDALPIADAGQNQTAVAGQTVLFDGSDSFDLVGIENYTWSFMYDGRLELLYGETPSFVFWTVGVYDVTLNVTDFAGHYNTSHVQITVVGEIPEFTSAMVPVLGSLILMLFVLIGRRRRPMHLAKSVFAGKWSAIGNEHQAEHHHKYSG